MELLSDIVTWGELYLDHWQEGSYTCSKCSNLLYRSEDKWKVKVQNGWSVVQ
jgi:peptide methionine sulfoxide reductase MsrB